MLQIKNTLGGGGGNPEGSYVWKKYEYTSEGYDPYLTFSGNKEFQLSTYNDSKNWDGTLEYSIDAFNWKIWDGTAIDSSWTNKLFLRGTGNTIITGKSGDSCCFYFLGDNTLRVRCEGNIENLLDYATVSAGSHPTMGSDCFKNLFDFCEYLIKPPELPATTLADACYASMFHGCNNLITAPKLPATTLAAYCYEYMFSGCSNLTTLPELPATILTFLGYHGMFYECKKIKLSSTQTGEYQTEYRIPISGTGTYDAADSDTLLDMFGNTGGTFTGTPTINTTYYLSTSNTVV